MIIGIAGNKGSGKSTVAAMLKELDPTFDVVQFADPLKDMAKLLCNRYLNMSLIDMDDESTKSMMTPLGVTVRYMLQTLGTEWGRDCIDKEMWIKIGLNRSIHAIIPDIRYVNEAKAVRGKGGYVFYVDRHSSLSDTHLSETEMHSDAFKAQINVVISNHSSLDNLKAIVTDSYTKLRRTQ